MGLFGPPDVGKLKIRRDIKGLVGALRYRASAVIRKNAALALAEVTANVPAKTLEMVIAQLIASFEDQDLAVVSACVQALGSIGHPAFLPLVSALRASNERTREASARAIGRIAPSSIDASRVKLSIDPLVALLHDPYASTRRASVWALGRISSLLEPSQKILIVESLVIALRDPSSEVRETAASSLGRTGESQAIRPLIASLEDASPAVRKIASEGLDLLGWAPATPVETVNFRIARQDWEGAVQVGPIAAAALIRIINASDQSSRLAAIKVLGRTGSPEVVLPLVTALKDEDETIRIAAAAALEQAGAPEAVDALLQTIRDRDREVRKAVALALGHTHDERAVPPILNMLRTREPDMVAIAGKALAGLGMHSVSYLTQMLSESEVAMQNLAAEILVQVGSPAVMPLIDLLRDGPPPANRLAANILGEIRDPRAVWPLISALQISDMTLPAVQAMGKIGDFRAVKPLIELLNSTFSETIQQATALALGGIGDPQAIDPLIQLLRASDREIRMEAAKALILLYRSGKLDLTQKRKIFDQQDRIVAKHTDIHSHTDEVRDADWHLSQNYHEDTGIGLDFPAPYH
jgi:HEAT repeat protein